MPTSNRQEESTIPDPSDLRENILLENDEDEFHFSSDDDDDVNGGFVDATDDPYRDYVLLSQDPQDPPGDQLYTHNIRVNWIETDQPLFNREAFEAQQQQRRLSSTEDSAEHSTDNTQGASVSNPDSTSSDSVKLDDEKIDTIKNLMANFKLPSESIPGWARDIPEDEWKNFLTNK